MEKEVIINIPNKINVDIGIPGAKGPKGDTGEKGENGKPFTYDDFTPTQLAALKGAKGDKGEKGDSLRFEDLTPDQIAQLKGPKGDTGSGGNIDLSAYPTKEYCNTTYATKNSLNTYLTKDDANSIYTSKTLLNDYLTVANANTTYLSKTDADTTYSKKTDLDNYVTKDNAVTKDGDNTFTGTVTVSQTSGLNLANHIFESNGNNLVIKSKNNTPILTLYPSVGYLNGREILNQFKADQLYIKKADSGNYVAKSQYDSDMTALLTELRKLNGTN